MKKSRYTRHTILIYCEGKTDYLFALHLKKLFPSRGFKTITLIKGRGGALSTFISDIENKPGEYDKKYIVLDSNGKREEDLREAQNQSQKHNIELIWQKPCLEGIFLRILKGNQFIKEKSESCKDIFYKKYTSDRKPLTEKLLNQLFTKLFAKDFLNTKRQEVPELDQLIRLMEKEKIK